MSAPAGPVTPRSPLRRAALPALLALALALAAGCTLGTRSPSGHAITPAWNAAALKRALPAVVLVRSRDLVAQRLGSATATTLWTAPAGTTPRILAVDQSGGRIAVLLHAAQDPALDSGPRRFFLLPWRDAGIEILSADGSGRRVAIHPHALHPEVNPNDASSEETIPDVVSSGAFAGDDVLLGMSPGVQYRFGGTYAASLVLKPDGRTLDLAAEATHVVPTEFLQLPSGRAATVWSGSSGLSIGMADYDGSGVRLASARFQPIANTLEIGTGGGANSVCLLANDVGTARLFVATYEGDRWTVVPGPPLVARTAYGARKEGLLVVDGPPQAGPDDGVLVATHSTPPTGRDGPTTERLVQTPGQRTGAAQDPLGITVEAELDGPTPTWTYVDRFGPTGIR